MKLFLSLLIAAIFGGVVGMVFEYYNAKDVFATPVPQLDYSSKEVEDFFIGAYCAGALDGNIGKFDKKWMEDVVASIKDHKRYIIMIYLLNKSLEHQDDAQPEDNKI